MRRLSGNGKGLTRADGVPLTVVEAAAGDAGVAGEEAGGKEISFVRLVRSIAVENEAVVGQV